MHVCARVRNVHVCTLLQALRRPSTLAPRLPWELSPLRSDPYSASFAVSALSPLLKTLVTVPNGSKRQVFFVGHSAGGPIALRALCEAAADRSFLPPRTNVAGAGLISPAVLDPQEDPDAYNADASSNDEALPLAVRIAAFRAILALPDALSLHVSRRLVDGRDLKQALLNQTHARMSLPEQAGRVGALVAKYAAPVEEYPEDWDTALMNVYRADLAARDDESILRGRKLLARARGSGSAFCVISGDDDSVVPVRASRRVSDLLSAQELEIMSKTGHLPMDERPQQLASLLLRFMSQRGS